MPRMSGKPVVGQRAGGQHHRARAEAFASVVLRPHAGALVEVERGHLGVEPDAPAQVELVDHVLDVRADLAARG